MITESDLIALAEQSAPERAFLSIYLKSPDSVAKLENRFHHIKSQIGRSDAEIDELEHFNENISLVRDYLHKNEYKSGGLCIFACWANDFFKVYKLDHVKEDICRIDSSPFLRPLAEKLDRYENTAVVIADNKKARIHYVTTTIGNGDELIKGNIKNHVRVGGWSQQRYERRRDKQLEQYSKEIVESLKEHYTIENYRHILLVGSCEILNVIQSELPKNLLNLVVEKSMDLKQHQGEINKEINELFERIEESDELKLWERIQSEFLADGLAIIGLSDVYHAAIAGRIEILMVDEGFKPDGYRCRNCDNLELIETQLCPDCGPEKFYKVDIVNEIIELVLKSGGKVEFVDNIEKLRESGSIAALTRY